METKQRDIESILNCGRTTVSRYFKALRQLCTIDLDRENSMLGGQSVVVEIDESLFARVKHHKGKDLKRKQVWVFGMRERGTNKCLFFVVENREASTLIPIIFKHVKEGSIVMSDCWRSYSEISKKYVHKTVNHSINFVAPDSKEIKIHTNGIER